jgi:plastocyanin
VRVVVALVLLAAPSAAGTVTGRVEMIEKGGKKATDLSDVVVYLDGVKARPQAGRAKITMRAKAFIPHVLVVPVGSTVDFPNEDPILHNAFSLSGENRFDLDLYKKPRSGAFTFQHPGIVRVYCNIHPQMSAVVVVRDNPFFTTAARDGAFSIDGVPPGRYTLHAWHERGAEVESEVVVPAAGPAEANLTLDASRYKRETHKNKFGKDYKDEKY